MVTFLLIFGLAVYVWVGVLVGYAYGEKKNEVDTFEVLAACFWPIVVISFVVLVGGYTLASFLVDKIEELFVLIGKIFRPAKVAGIAIRNRFFTK